MCLFCCVCFYSFSPEEESDGRFGTSHRTSHYRTVRLHSDHKAFEFDSAAKVTAVHRQARVRGVKAGMRIAAVDGNSVKSGREAKQRLVCAHRMRDSFTVTLVDDRARRSAASSSARASRERKSSLLGSTDDARPGHGAQISRPASHGASMSLSRGGLGSSSGSSGLLRQMLSRQQALHSTTESARIA